MNKKKKKKPEEEVYIFDLRKTFISRLFYAPETRIFRECWCVDSKGKSVDVCKQGLFSCALFVSNFAKMHNLIKIPTANCDTLKKELISCNWYPCRDLKSIPPCAVVFWEPREANDGKMHEHVGFCYAPGYAVSADPRTEKEGSTHSIIVHELDCSDVLKYRRKIMSAYFHPLLMPSKA